MRAQALQLLIQARGFLQQLRQLPVHLGAIGVGPRRARLFQGFAQPADGTPQAVALMVLGFEFLLGHRQRQHQTLPIRVELAVRLADLLIHLATGLGQFVAQLRDLPLELPFLDGELPLRQGHTVGKLVALLERLGELWIGAEDLLPELLLILESVAASDEEGHEDGDDQRGLKST